MSEAEVDLTKHFINKLNDCLNENKFKEALGLFEGNENDDTVKESSWDIVPNVSSHLTTENVKSNRDKFECCAKILYAVVEKCDPSETVLELLEQVEESDDGVKFCIIFNLLTRCFSKMNDKMKAIEWCTSTIRCYIGDMSLPQDETPSVIIDPHSIKNIYNAVLSFLEPLVNEAALDTSGKSAALKDYLASILIFLLGEPLCYVEEKELESQQPEPPLPEKIIMLVSRVTSDLLWFLNVAIMRSEQARCKNPNMGGESTNLKVVLFELDENVPDLAYANFYFYVITKLHLWEKVPQVYDTKYIFEGCTYLIITLFKEPETIEKGLDLMEQLLRKMTKQSLTSQLLKLNIYIDLFTVLKKIMIYSSMDKERRKALHVFQEYIEMFDMEARYLIVLHLYQTSEHSGLLSLTTGIFKGFVIECLQATPPMPHFLGKNLESLIKLACKLPHGSRSDIVELSDEIIASLNLLRFLFLRDMQNQTGIWYLLDKLQNDYLEPLREGVNLCRVYWKVKVKDLEEQRKTHRTSKNVELENGSTEVTLTVGGERLPAMPLPDKIFFSYQALNGLDVVESILIRVNECIVNNPIKSHSNRIILE